MSLMFALSPLLVVMLGGLLLMLAEALGKPNHAAGINAQGVVIDAGLGRMPELALGAAVVLFSGAIMSIAVWLVGPEKIGALSAVAPYILIDRFTLFFSFVICISGGFSALLAGGYLPEHGIERGEFFQLLIFSAGGAIALAAAGDLLSLFVALETMSLGVYCMIGLRRSSPRAAEASLKYFLLGSFAAALMLFGFALLYGATGHTDLVGIAASIAEVQGPNTAALLLGVALTLAGLAFKVSAVPFHMWTPDAYEGAPTPATSFMAAAVKAAAFAVLLRVVIGAFGDERLMSWAAGWPPMLALLALLSMTVGNIVAGRQESVKRMLAYSSIAHAGYALVGVVSALRSPAAAQASVMFYMLTYALSTVGAFGALILCGSKGKEAVSYEDLAGVGRRYPASALAFSIFLVSLAGIPPTAGFFGKLYVFTAAMDAQLYWLVVIGMLNSVLGAYYYLKVMVYMYMREPRPGAVLAVPMKSGLVNAALIALALAVALLGVFPGTALHFATSALP